MAGSEFNIRLTSLITLPLSCFYHSSINHNDNSHTRKLELEQGAVLAGEEETEEAAGAEVQDNWSSKPYTGPFSYFATNWLLSLE